MISALRERDPDGQHTIVHTGQHYDHLMSEVFLEELGVPAPDFMLEVGSGAHSAQTGKTMERLEPVLVDQQPDLVLVPGDVNSTWPPPSPQSSWGSRGATSSPACAAST